MKKLLVALSIGYVVIVLLIGSLGVVLTQEYDEEKIKSGEPIIYTYDAMLLGIKCENTFWDEGNEIHSELCPMDVAGAIRYVSVYSDVSKGNSNVDASSLPRHSGY